MSASTTVSWIVIPALSAWFVLSVLAQWRGGRLVERLIAHDRFGTVPLLTFLAPVPMTDDLHVLYRDRSADGALTPWRELDPDRAPALRPVWNPGLRVSRAMADLCSAVIGSAAAPPAPGRLLLLQAPYLLVLGTVCANPAAPQAQSRQFLVARTRGRDGEASPTCCSYRRSTGWRDRLRRPRRGSGGDQDPRPGGRGSGRYRVAGTARRAGRGGIRRPRHPPPPTGPRRSGRSGIPGCG